MRKVLIFISLCIIVLTLNTWLIQQGGNQQAQNGQDEEGQDGDDNQDDANQDDANQDGAQGGGEPGNDDAQAANQEANAGNQGGNEPALPAQEQFAHRRHTLGSLDPDSDFVMLVTVNNRGGVIERIELNNKRFLNLEARRQDQGYLGHLAPRNVDGGVEVTVVGPGTPAANAGFQPGDVITAITVNEQENPIETTTDWDQLLDGDLAKVGTTWTLSVTEAGQGAQVRRDVQLVPLPISLVAPENSAGLTDPLSMRLTINEISDVDGESVTLKGSIPEATDIAKYLKVQNGVIVVGKVPQGHPLQLAGFQEGDRIFRLDYREFSSQQELESYLDLVASGSWLRADHGEGGKEISLIQLPAEMPSLNLHDANWEVTRADEQVVELRYTDAQYGLELVKRYALAKVSDLSEEDQELPLPPAYHLTMDIEIINKSAQTRQLAYQLDGFNGLSREGWWYGSKLARGWFEAIGTRDVLFEFGDHDPNLIGAPYIAQYDDLPILGDEVPLRSVSTDARYFSASLIPVKEEGAEDNIWFERAQAVRVGIEPHAKYRQRTNTTFRLIGSQVTLAEGESVKRSFRLFTGPKSTDLLAEEDYALSELVYYGWPIWGVFAKMLQSVLHFIYGIIPNYAIAIVILTIIVRGMMFPLSRKNALGAQKMQTLQPEMRKINEKFKNNPQERMRATQELFRKHNYHPLGGCLMLFVQLPIFIGLYRALMLDVELRQAPLIPGLPWCDNLAAPDMLFYWGDWTFLPSFLTSEVGFLGPYFNLLPILTIGLFIAQQKMFMPPPMDDQQRMQQKIMKYMMLVFAFIFFKVPSGLCLYFIVSSLWGIAERQFLPKTNRDQPQQTEQEKKDEASEAVRERRRMASSGGNGASKKSGGKQRTKPKK